MNECEDGAGMRHYILILTKNCGFFGLVGGEVRKAKSSLNSFIVIPNLNSNSLK